MQDSIEMTNEMLINILRNSVERIDLEKVQKISIGANTEDDISTLTFIVEYKEPDAKDAEPFYMETGSNIKLQY
ncbi:hypothetical protein [Eremococcus coleocola]|uniref:hypothetical protein n=1 Tax=Eremococcus coleocola TaxID=88132 RepID=UPI00040B25DF|nr:hypothetical protein [Eremococcus coleocola]